MRGIRGKVVPAQPLYSPREGSQKKSAVRLSFARVPSGHRTGSSSCHSDPVRHPFVSRARIAAAIWAARALGSEGGPRVPRPSPRQPVRTPRAPRPAPPRCCRGWRSTALGASQPPLIWSSRSRDPQESSSNPRACLHQALRGLRPNLDPPRVHADPFRRHLDRQAPQRGSRVELAGDPVYQQIGHGHPRESDPAHGQGQWATLLPG